MRRNVIDRMALLCTLHADGPRTLRLLREAGCTTIEKLGQTRPEKVGKLLGLPPAAARRLTKEALRLIERLEPDLEQEEVTYPPAARPAAVKPPPKGYRLEEPAPAAEEPGPAAEGPAPAAEGPAPESESEALKSRDDLDLRDRALLDRVVERWRSEEAVQRQGTAEEEQTLLRQIEIQGGTVRAVQEAESVVGVLGSPVATLAQEAEGRLEPGHLPGLDPEASLALERGGIHCLEDLATCPIDELVTRSGLAFTRSRTLQFLAGRRLAERPVEASPIEGGPGHETPPEPEELPTERLSPRERPAFLEPALGGLELLDDGGVAGPFA